VYHVETWSALREPPQQGHELGLRFNCPKDRCAELKGAVLGVLAELRQKGVEPGHLDALREQRARALDGAQRAGELWLEALADAYRRGNDPTQVLAERTQPARLSSAALRAAARRYLRVEQHLDALLEPEAGSSTQSPRTQSP
jgi:hypothetical protein